LAPRRLVLGRSLPPFEDGCTLVAQRGYRLAVVLRVHRYP
jgi:hypothetical protein